MNQTLDFIGIGVGPFNLSIAALGSEVSGFNCKFFERKPHFPGTGHDGAGLPHADQFPERFGQCGITH